MNVVQRGYNSIASIPVEAVLLEKGFVFIEGEITPSLVMEATKQIMYLVNRDDVSDIYILIDSPGGDVQSSLSLCDTISDYSDRIYTVCLSRAYSMAAVIMACGAAGRRLIIPSGELMLHEPLSSGGISGSYSSVKASTERLDSYRKKLIDILCKHSGFKKEAISRFLRSSGRFFSADECLSFGLCDRIIGLSEILKEE